MPRLIVFVACENVILAQNTNTASLIILMNELTTLSNIPEPLPPNAATQMRWYIYAEWEIVDGDVGTRFSQKIEMIGPDGNIVAGMANTTEFVPEPDKTIHRIVAGLTFFPLLPPGRYRLHLSIRKVDEGDWDLRGDYPLSVKYAALDAPA